MSNLPSVDNSILVRHDKSSLGNAQRCCRVEVIDLPLNLLHPFEHLAAGPKVVPVRDTRASGYFPPAVCDGLAFLVPVPVGTGFDPALLRSRRLDQRCLSFVHIHVALNAVYLPRRAVLPDNIVSLVGAGGVVLGNPVFTVGGEGRGGDFVLEPVFRGVETCSVASVVDCLAEFYTAICTNCLGGV